MQSESSKRETIIAVPSIAVIGCGHWGKNLVRTFHALGALRQVCDALDATLAEVASNYNVSTTGNFDSVLDDAATQAVVISTPAAQHYEMAKRALLKGKDVYVEKPLALHAEQALELTEIAARRRNILMVGHILQYHPAILELKRLIDSGDMGKIRYIHSTRLNLGKLRTEENILWSFAPHDVSAILYLLNEPPARVWSHGGSYLQSHIPDTTLTTCEFKSGVQAHIFVSWLHPFKEQKLTIVGERQMAVFDDVEVDRKLVLYPHRIEWRDRVPVACKTEGWVVPLLRVEPLRVECEHFLKCVQTREVPRTDGQNGVRVLQVLEASELSLRDNGRAIDIGALQVKPRYFAHPTTAIDASCIIGANTKVWHFSHVMSGSSIGECCNLGQNVVIGPGVKIGNNVKIQNNVSVYTGVELEDNVFCGPSMVFTNVGNPRSHVERKSEYRRTLVREGASIGANATIICGVTLGRYSFVAAGTVVTRDVPDYALVMGVPAKRVGWVCYCGIRLPESAPEMTCAACQRTYVLRSGSCEETSGRPALLPESRVSAAA
jgi:UDP-2-acetamido-3-amino-2,3-dideoxy-glucuronate N-acetyltransferase